MSNSRRHQLEETIREYPDDYESMWKLGDLLVEQSGEHKTAQKHFKKAIKINPNYGKAHFSLAHLLITYINSKKNILPLTKYIYYKNARKHLTLFLSINPNSAYAHTVLGQINELYFNKYDEARKHYSIAIELNENDADTHYYLSRLLKEHFSEYDKALVHAQLASELANTKAGDLIEEIKICQFAEAIDLKEKDGFDRLINRLSGAVPARFAHVTDRKYSSSVSGTLHSTTTTTYFHQFYFHIAPESQQQQLYCPSCNKKIPIHVNTRAFFILKPSFLENEPNFREELEKKIIRKAVMNDLGSALLVWFAITFTLGTIIFLKFKLSTFEGLIATLSTLLLTMIWYSKRSALHKISIPKKLKATYLSLESYNIKKIRDFFSSSSTLLAELEKESIHPIEFIKLGEEDKIHYIDNPNRENYPKGFSLSEIAYYHTGFFVNHLIDFKMEGIQVKWLEQ